MAQSFYPNPFLPLNIVSSHWPTPAASPHLGGPLNGQKQLKRRSQWGFSQVFPLMMIKVSLPFMQNKIKPENYNLLNTLESNTFSIDQKPVS